MFVRAHERKHGTATEDRLDKRTKDGRMSRVLMFATLPAGGIVSLAAAEHQAGTQPLETKSSRVKANAETRFGELTREVDF
jgi:hypothetical protein